MARLIFLEGISGVGKSTMARSLCDDLQSKGLSAKAYVEFDYTNPIDFYCVAYYTSEEYEMLCAENSENENAIRSNTIDAIVIGIHGARVLLQSAKSCFA